MSGCLAFGMDGVWDGLAIFLGAFPRSLFERLYTFILFSFAVACWMLGLVSGVDCHGPTLDCCSTCEGKRGLMKRGMNGMWLRGVWCGMV